MAKNGTFLLRFQEPCQLGDDTVLGTATETRAREESDQDHHGWAGMVTSGLPTKLDLTDRVGGPNASEAAIVASMIAMSLGTRTETKAREENDQDHSNLSMGTMTVTATREETDADSGHSGYYVLPRMG